MFFKLVLKNASKSVKDYLVYFLTLMFGVCLFYLFNSIDAQTVMLKIDESQKEILKTLVKMVGYVSVFISVILGFLVVYANGFLMKRRKKELGVYMTLGMPKRKISAVIIFETLLVGLLSLAAGIAAGIFLSQGMSAVTAKLFEADLSQFVFTFSKDAFWKTLVYFGVMFLVVVAFNTLSVSRLKLIDLLSAGRRNQRLRIGRLWVSVVIFLVSVGCLAASYHLIETNGMIQFTPEFAASLALGSVGTLLFFLSLSGFLLRVVQSNQKLYFKNLNMFVLRQFNSKINTTFVSVSVICIMLLITIGTLSTGMGISNALSKDLRQSTPYDVSFSAYVGNGVQRKSSNIEQNLKKSGINLADWADRYAQINFYVSDFTYGAFFQKSDWPKELGNFDHSAGATRVNAVSLSDFNKVRKMRGEPPVSLKQDQYGVSCTIDSLLSLYEKNRKTGRKISFGGKSLVPAAAEKAVLMNGYGSFGDVIVPDALLRGRTSVTTILNLNYKPGVNGEAFLKKVKAIHLSAPEQPYDFYDSKAELCARSVGYKVMVSYLALYIGLVFLIAAAAVLALQQLSESSDNAERYGLLRKLGAEEKMVNRALLAQIALYFLLPLSLAIVHSAVGIDVANRVITDVGNMDVLGNIVMTAVIVLAVYGAYFLATYLGSKSMIRQKNLYRRTE